MEKEKWGLCPICSNKTRIQVRPDTVSENFHRYCPKCKRETIISVTGQNAAAVNEMENDYGDISYATGSLELGMYSCSPPVGGCGSSFCMPEVRKGVHYHNRCGDFIRGGFYHFKEPAR